MAAETLASGQVLITASADQLAVGLKQAEQKVNASGGKMASGLQVAEHKAATLGKGVADVGVKAQKAGDNGKQAMNQLAQGAKLGSVESLSLAAALGSVALAAGKAFEATIVAAFNRELERSVMLARELARLEEKRATKIFADAEDKTDRGRQGFLGGKLKEESKLLHDLEPQLAKAREEVKKLESDLARQFAKRIPIMDKVPFVKESLEGPEKEAANRLAELESRYKKQLGTVEKIKEELGKTEKAIIANNKAMADWFDSGNAVPEVLDAMQPGLTGWLNSLSQLGSAVQRKETGFGAWANKLDDEKEAPKFQEPKFAGAVEAGSKEAYSIQLRNQYGDMAGDKTGDAAVDEQKKANRKLDSIDIHMRGLHKLLENIGAL